MVENIYLSDIEMINIPSQAISFNLFYSGRSVSEDMEAGSDGQQPKLLPVTDETPQFKNIFFRNIHCKGAFQGIYMEGLPELNLENIQFDNIQMEADFGLICSDATGVKIKNLQLQTKKMPVMDIKNSRNISIDGLTTAAGALPVIRLSGSKTENIELKNSGIITAEKQVVVGKEVPANAVKLE